MRETRFLYTIAVFRKICPIGTRKWGKNFFSKMLDKVVFSCYNGDKIQRKEANIMTMTIYTNNNKTYFVSASEDSQK